MISVSSQLDPSVKPLISLPVAINLNRLISIQITATTLLSMSNMNHLVRGIASAFAGFVASVTIFSSSITFGQSPRGGEIRIAPLATGEERTSQDNLWVLEVYFKPMRLIPVELTDPKTGEKKREYVWYIAYRAMHQKTGERVDEKAPENQFDPPVSPPMFIPEFTLVVTDNDRQDIFPDQVIPEALAAINKREKANYKTTVNIVGPLPEATDPGSGDTTALSGVAMWRGIDPEADRYTVYMTGFSNGIRKVDGPDGKPIVQTKTIMQRYWRRGDRFEQREPEITLDGESKWIYR